MIYVIIGTTGEYSDRDEWVAGYCKSKQKAKAIIKYWSALAREIESGTESHTPERDAALEAHPDEYADMDYTGMSYHFAIAKEIK